MVISLGLQSYVTKYNSEGNFMFISRELLILTEFTTALWYFQRCAPFRFYFCVLNFIIIVLLQIIHHQLVIAHYWATGIPHTYYQKFNYYYVNIKFKEFSTILSDDYTGAFCFNKRRDQTPVIRSRGQRTKTFLPFFLVLR